MAKKVNMKTSSKKAIGIGAGLIAAAALGAYYFYGKDGDKHRKNAKAWMLKAKGEILERLEKAEDVSEDTYNHIVAEVMRRYKAMKQVDPAELAALMADLKRYWKILSKGAKSNGVKKHKRSSR
ncbi:MAG: hypothetical protein V1489_02630 [Candidatus Liptonbacteria bacterium]